MRPLTIDSHPTPRRGFTVAELIVAMLLFAIIGAAIVKTLSAGQRAYDSQAQHIDLQQNMRLAASFLPAEFRELNASDDDIQAMDSVSMKIRSMRQLGFVCTVPGLGGALTGQILPGVTFAVRDSMMGIRYFAQGDSVMLWYEGDPLDRRDDSWVLASLTTNPVTGAATSCTDGSGKTGRLFTANLLIDNTIAPPQQNKANMIPAGAPIRAFQSVTYKRVKVNNEWYVGFDSAGVSSTERALIGPLADSLGFKLTYYDSLDNKLVAPFDAAKRRTVARISMALALKTTAALRKNIGSPAPDTSRVTLEVAVRNNRRY